MTAHHFFLPSVDGDELTVEGEDARHAVRVLRIGPGERVTISDGRGTVVAGSVVEASRSLRVAVSQRHVVPAPTPKVCVYQGLPKHGKLDDIVQMLTQAGVATVVPVRTSRSVARWDDAKAAANVARLRSVAREAAMQSRRAFLPDVAGPVGVGDVPAGTIVLHEGATERLGSVLAEAAPSAVSLFVGPEGGFDEDEIAGLAGRGCSIASLGDTVFRTEVAAFAAVAVVHVRYGILG